MSGDTARTFGPLPFIGYNRHVPCMDHPAVYERLGETSTPTNAILHMGRSICGSCPVLFECREYAIDHQETWGMWGGLTAEELWRRRASESERARRDARRERDRVNRQKKRELECAS